MNLVYDFSRWLLFVVFLNIILIVCLLFIESSDEKILLWARYTARISFFFFIISFSASSMCTLFSNRFTRFVRNQRRYIGLSFALAHTVHLIALTTFFITSSLPPDIFTLVTGGLGYAVMYLMAVTSNDKAVKKLGFRRWKLLHKFGVNYIAIIFTVTYFGKLVREKFVSIEFSLLLSIVFFAFLLRMLNFLRTRNTVK